MELRSVTTSSDVNDKQHFHVPKEQTTVPQECADSNFSVITGTVTDFMSNHQRALRRAKNVVFMVLYFSYFGYAMYYRFGDEGSWRLAVCTIFGAFCLTWGMLKKTSFTVAMDGFQSHIGYTLGTGRRKKIIRWLLYVGMSIFMTVYIVLNVAITRPRNLISLSGIAVFLLIMFIISTNKRKVNWHTVFWGMTLQFVFALIVLETEWGYSAIRWAGYRVEEFMKYSDAGAKFVFGNSFIDHRFAFQTMPSVLCFSVAVSVLVYLGVIQVIVKYLGSFLAFCLDTSAHESINVAANIFLGLIESALLISEYLGSLTTSQLFVVIAAGMTCSSGYVLIQFLSFGVPADYLLAASVMSAPAALAASKLVWPDVEKERYELNKPEELSSIEVSEWNRKPGNVVEAIANGVRRGITLVPLCLANVIVFFAILDFVNATLTWFGDRVGVPDLTFQLIASYVFFPLAYVMGTPYQDCFKVAELLGLKVFTTPGLAYIQLGRIIQNGDLYRNYISNPNNTVTHTDDGLILDKINTTLSEGILTSRAEIITSYALCGDGCIPGVGVYLGALTAIMPSREKDIIKVLPRAFIVSSLACYLTACIAGLLHEEIPF